MENKILTVFRFCLTLVKVLVGSLPGYERFGVEKCLPLLEEVCSI